LVSFGHSASLAQFSIRRVFFSWYSRRLLLVFFFCGRFLFFSIGSRSLSSPLSIEILLVSFLYSLLYFWSVRVTARGVEFLTSDLPPPASFPRYPVICGSSQAGLVLSSYASLMRAIFSSADWPTTESQPVKNNAGTLPEN